MPRHTKAKVPLAGAMQKVVSVLQAVMDRRIAFRLAILIAGMLLADRRERSWDNPDRRRCISREMLHEKFLAALPKNQSNRDFQRLFEALVTLAL